MTKVVRAKAGTRPIRAEITAGFTEMLLAKNKTYLFRLTNVSGQAKDASIVIEFYEEE